jgi:hypothetical protein
MPNLSWTEVRDRAIAFSRAWAESASEHADKQTFWNEFFAVFGRERRTVASFEVAVKSIHGSYNFIDLLWRGVLLVEHKTRGKSLAVAESQGFAYIEDLAREGRFEEIPRFVIVSDFARIALYDLEPDEQGDLPLVAGRPYAVTNFGLSEFHRYIRNFAFLKGERTVRIREEDPANQKAYDRMCQLHDELEANGFTGEPLERCLVRLLFCLFADDTGVFEPDTFETFIETRTREDGSDLGLWLNKLFAVLNTRETKWNVDDKDIFAGFRYVNGDLFKDALPFPSFNRSTRKALLDAGAFQWARVSPAVFGSLFQGIMEKGERRQRGAHYTSERDILKVVNSLFLESLDAELVAISGDASTRRAARIKEYLAKLRSLHFLDPACGCGNFLVISYRELRRLELRALRELHADGAQAEALGLLVRVDVDQFYGIEIDRWPAEIARAAMWLMDHQMNQEVSEAFARDYARLPLQTSPHISTDNALLIDWKTVLDPKDCSFVLGNPPFVGGKFQTDEQRANMALVAGDVESYGLLDFVCGWYLKAADYIAGTKIRCAFVSTNSITQGEQAGTLWNHLFQHHHLKIQFAHRTFPWASEARGAAHVHVVIIGFGAFDISPKHIYDIDQNTGQATSLTVANISPYLINGPDKAITNRSKPLCDAPEIGIGNKPIDGGHYLFTPDERAAFLAIEPESAPYFRQWQGAEEFINSIERWCLWLGDAEPAVLQKLPECMKRVEAVRASRASSKSAPTQKLAATPRRFHVEFIPPRRYMVIPEVSSERRRYIPMGFISPEVLSSNKLRIIPAANLWHFGVLASAMHMAWVRVVTGRLKSDYQYSIKLVYNNYPWPANVDAKQRKSVEAAAQSVLDARKPFLPPAGKSTLADLYDPLTMPAPLAKAHTELDRAVDRCYRDTQFKSDRDRVEHLFNLFEKLTSPPPPEGAENSHEKQKLVAVGQADPTSEEKTSDEQDENASPEGNTILSNPPWYEDVLVKMNEGFIDDGTDRLADKLEEMISVGNFAQCDADLGIIADREAQYPPDALISLLTFSRAAKSQLPNRARLRDAVQRRLIALGKNPDVILRRL